MPKRRMTPARQRQIAMWSLAGRKAQRSSFSKPKIPQSHYRGKSLVAYSTMGNYPSYRSSLPAQTGTNYNRIETAKWNNKVRIPYRSIERTVLLNKSTIDGSRGYQYHLKPKARVYRY